MYYDWFKNAKKGLMIHWGLYSVFGGQYNGRIGSNYSEWVQSFFKISCKEMEKVASTFNPINFNADNWVKFAKDNGFQYIIFTAKHHDGFAMFNSKVDHYNIYESTPFKRDIVKELADSCKKFDVKFGIYYSQDLDWHEKNGGGFNTPIIDCAGSSWCNNWDFNDKDKNFDEYFYKKSLPQIEELMKNYGEIAIAWFDIPFTLSKKQSKEIYDLVKLYQPNCLINSRLGNGLYDYVSFGDNQIPNSYGELTHINSKENDINGVKFSPYNLYEACCTLNQSWGFTKNPKWKSVKELTTNKQKANSLGINYLINIGADEFGNLPENALNILKNLK
jgi:alpha-L-fucosidase